MRTLIVKPSSLGDVIHALPVLRLLKLHFPSSEIHWWLASNLAPLLERDPDLSGIIPFGRTDHASLRQWPEIFRRVRELRSQRFDWVIDLQGLARSGIFAWLANGGLCIGLDNDREGRREGAQIFYDVLAPRSPPGTHAVERYLSVLSVLDVPRHDHFEWLPARQDVAKGVQLKWAPHGAPWIILLPGARWESKRWPVENFCVVVRELASERPDLRFAILGGAGDRRLAQVITGTNQKACLDLTGQTSLPEMIEWIRLSQLVVTNDTGPMHVAAALRKPVLAVFGPTNPDLTGPYGQRERVLRSNGLPCIPCMKSSCSYSLPLACLRAITPEMVGARAREILCGSLR